MNFKKNIIFILEFRSTLKKQIRKCKILLGEQSQWRVDVRTHGDRINNCRRKLRAGVTVAFEYKADWRSITFYSTWTSWKFKGAAGASLCARGSRSGTN